MLLVIINISNGTTVVWEIFVLRNIRALNVRVKKNCTLR